MTRWLLLNLRGGMTGDLPLVKASTLADIHSPQMTTGATPNRPDISPATYGMGWMIDTYRGHRRVHHGGGIDGFITSVVLFPDDDLGLVAFNNRGAGLPALLTQHAADRVLGLDEIDWVGESLEQIRKGKEVQGEATEKQEATRVTGTAPSHPAGDYVGEFEHPGYGTLRVIERGDGLAVVYNGITGPLEHWHYDVWNGTDAGDDPTFDNQKFIFRGNVDGLISFVESTFEARADPIVFRKRPDSRMFDPAYLGNLVATYETATGTKLNVELSGGKLTMTVPGQPTLHARTGSERPLRPEGGPAGQRGLRDRRPWSGDDGGAASAPGNVRRAPSEGGVGCVLAYGCVLRLGGWPINSAMNPGKKAKVHIRNRMT